MRPITELAEKLEAAWLRLDYDERAFPALAADMLREARLHERLDHGEALRWMLTQDPLPTQDDLGAQFGDPPLTVYHGRRFYVQVLFWLEGTTAIHKHAFSGAFQVLDGTSLHSRWGFTLRRRVSSRFLLGDVQLLDATLLERGDVVEVPSRLVHALFHLDTPSATIVVRTYREEDAVPQYVYKPPFIAIDPYRKDAILVRQLQGLWFARKTERSDYLALAADIVGRSDLQTAWEVLFHLSEGRGAPVRTEPVLEVARRRHGAAMDELVAVLREELRGRKLARLRDGTRDPDLRFFLAMLANLPDRDAIFAQIRRRYPGGDPRARVAAWLDALSGVQAIGIDLEDELNRAVVHALLDGCDEAALHGRLEQVFEPAQVGAQAAALTRHVERIRRTALGPLFRAGQAAASG